MLTPDQSGTTRPGLRPPSEWPGLDDDALRAEIKARLDATYDAQVHAIVRGEYASLYHEYARHVRRTPLAPRVDRVLLDLIDASDTLAAEKALALCHALRISGLAEKLLGVVPSLETFLATLTPESDFDAARARFALIHTADAVIARSALTEAMPFLIKQLEFRDWVRPARPTPAHPWSCAQAADNALRRLARDPRVAWSLRVARMAEPYHPVTVSACFGQHPGRPGVIEIGFAEIDFTAGRQRIVLEASIARPPFEDLVRFLEEIAAGALPSLFELDDDGTTRQVVALPLTDASLFRFTLPPGFTVDTSRRAFTAEVYQQLTRFVASAYDADAWCQGEALYDLKRLDLHRLEWLLKT